MERDREQARKKAKEKGFYKNAYFVKVVDRRSLKSIYIQTHTNLLAKTEEKKT